jgi:hypothetical protein
VSDVVRLFLTVWLAGFVVQSTDLLASIIPDDCVEETRGSAFDPCPENCARCVCCARVPVFVPQVHAAAPTAAPGVADLLPPIDRPMNPAPRGILHVPRIL